ncbi:hypothetical protein [Micrococcus endophyticus]|uniref:hypothetical protein n=1 Tax=Micrococcus endophyticus TaxID=455343 RepID=UPI00130E4014|nr:hypothetical protein [Micrococcus endophyticus]MCK6091166.1 hypothetical protein [Micrococcus endophyticus]
MWDASAWEPTETVARVLTTEEERLAAYEEDRAAQEGAWRREHGTEPPEATRARWMDSHREANRAVAECMTERGFPSEVGASGSGVTTERVPGQEYAEVVAFYVCFWTYPVDPAMTRQWSPEQIGVMFDYWDEYYIPCMEAHGYPMDTSSRPSRDACIARLHTPDRIDWSPPSLRQKAIPEVEQEQLHRECPEMPPDKHFYGVGADT